MEMSLDTIPSRLCALASFDHNKFHETDLAVVQDITNVDTLVICVPYRHPFVFGVVSLQHHLLEQGGWLQVSFDWKWG